MRQQRFPGPPAVLRLPRLSWHEVDLLKEALDDLEEPAMTDKIKLLIDKTAHEFRVVTTPQGNGIIYYDMVVPPELNKVIILDASYRIRKLEQMDPTIRDLAYYAKDIVSYENVTVHHLKIASGRASLTRDFRDEEQRIICKEIADVIKEIPGDEGIVIFTFKMRTVDFEQILKDELTRAGIDIESMVKVGDNNKTRFNFLTWGNETYLSEYSYCSNIIFAGVLHRSHIDLAAQIAAQKNDLTTQIESDLLLEVMDSEVTHCLYQAMSRGSCRIILGRVTKPMHVWLIHPNTRIKPLLEKVMPGIRWVPWRPQHYKHRHRQEQIAFAIYDYLEKYEGERISTGKLRKELNLQNVSKRTWYHGLRIFLEMTDKWDLKERSLVRLRKQDFFDSISDAVGGYAKNHSW